MYEKLLHCVNEIIIIHVFSVLPRIFRMVAEVYIAVCLVQCMYMCNIWEVVSSCERWLFLTSADQCCRTLHIVCTMHIYNCTCVCTHVHMYMCISGKAKQGKLNFRHRKKTIKMNTCNNYWSTRSVSVLWV